MLNNDDQRMETPTTPSIIIYEGTSMREEFFIIVRAIIASIICVGHFLMDKFTTWETFGGLALVIIWMAFSHYSLFSLSIEHEQEDQDK